MKVNTMRLRYNDTSAIETRPGGTTEEFEKTAVLQGDALGPYLFIIVLDYALREALSDKEEKFGSYTSKTRSRRLDQTRKQTLNVQIDDICLITDEIEDA